jgi:2-hydroxychromene-2-carboxylate isomerase
MSATVDFYFDFSSPYGYFASCRVDAIVERHGCDANWRPYLMGPVMKKTGAVPLSDRPVVYGYAERDVHRTARLHDIPFGLPDPFPVRSVTPCRVFYWLADRDPLQAREFAKRIFTTFFIDGRNISEPAVVVDVAVSMNIDREAVTAALNDPATQERIRQETDTAMERGVFGAPYVIVDGEPFWGNDRLTEVGRWLETGGW